MTTLDEIQARADAATKGPWRIQNDSECDYEAGIRYAEWPQTLVGPEQAHPSTYAKERGDTRNIDEINELTFHDAEFIAHAREDVPRLVCVIRAVEATMEDLDVARTEGRIHTYGQIQKAVRDAIREALG